MRHIRIITFLVSIIVSPMYSNAYNIRQISSRDGLSNSAVICLFQDTERYLWIGTYDGLNKYNSVDIQIYKPDVKKQNSLSGNVIRKVIESRDGYLWLMTKWGLNKYSKKEDRVEAYYNEFKEDNSIACDSRGNIFILAPTGVLYYYDFLNHRFTNIASLADSPYRGWFNLIIDSNDKVWVTNNGIIKQFTINWNNDSLPSLERLNNFQHTQAITHIFYDNKNLIIVDETGDLFTIDQNKKKKIRNIRPEITENGDITSIIFDNNDILIGFRTSGLIKLNQKKNYEAEKIPINCGVFSLLKDDLQDILWIGTDGQGIYACTKDEYTFKGITLDELPIKNPRPVRAIYSDQNNDLWLGTKGNGIIRIKDYNDALEYSRSNVQHLTSENGLSNNAIFAFEMSKRNNVLWIGSSGPDLNYYSYDDKKIHQLKNNDRTPFIEVHSLLETSDSTLWVASLNSLLKVNIKKNGNILESQNIRRYEFDIKNKQTFNQIYSVYQENDSIIWLAMRGNGAIRLNSINGNYKLITFDKDGIAPMNDILSIYLDKNGNKWFGSSYGINGIINLPDNKLNYKNLNENDGLLNNTIHGILGSSDGKLWLSSNAGVILFDPLKNTFRSFNQKTGLKVIEFSDNAYHKDNTRSRYFFGGVDGVIWIDREDGKQNNFNPPVNFTHLRIFNEEHNINSFIEQEESINRLRLKYNQNFFTISFIANDFINGANGKYSYKLEKFSDVWMNSNNHEAQFTNIPPGEYILKVKYNGIDTEGSQIASLNIIILPPWYLNIYAKIIYTIAIIFVLVLIYIYAKKKYVRKRMKIEQELDRKYNEEMYEGKLRFFTNITHELCTPLTLIYSPSERILNYAKSDPFIKRYALIIKNNAEKLNDLIQEIIDFRRIETGNKICKIKSYNINDICTEIVESFTDLAEENHINFSLDIPSSVIWNSDKSCIIKILNNLTSNAFKYTSENGLISIMVRVENDELVFDVYNTGKGIKKEDIPYIFNRYAILDSVKTNSVKGLSSRNGLGLAICKSMVELLEGRIDVESEVGKYARFIVRLPFLSSNRTDESEVLPIEYQGLESNIHEYQISSTEESKPDSAILQNSGNRPLILVVDDNEEILYLLKDILSEDFDIVTAQNGTDGYNKLTQVSPELVITDIMMPGQDGISFTKYIKSNPYTMHIPLIMLSAKSSINNKIEGIESGADAYISKPFNTQYLKVLIKQLIERKNKLQEYYNSSASALEFVNGQIQTKEDCNFIQMAIQIVEQNIDNIEFGPEDLADNLQSSIRTLYRRFKDVGLPPPKDFIKHQRIVYAAKLILSTTLTIQEIMYKVGFTTRSHFYKEFTKHYNQSPKEYREKRNL